MTGIATHERMPVCGPAEALVRMVVWSRPGRATCQHTIDSFSPATSLHVTNLHAERHTRQL